MKAKFAGNFLLVLLLLSLATMPVTVSAQDDAAGDIEITSGGQAYKSYLAVPEGEGPHPGVILIHSNRGLEQGYKTMSDQLAEQGFVVLALGWQTFERDVPDATVKQLIEDGIAFLGEREDVDSERLGLTGFCAGGRYTMLFLPQIKAFKAGVAWYGFPYRGETQPASLVGDLEAPMLVIHGTEDEPSPIADIYKYATELQGADKYFELKVYAGEPHGFMLANGEMRDDDIADDAFAEMADFFTRKLSVTAIPE